ncbi:hypothetical protein Asp14428_68630 [Actinoplanes sp. NBRC 14428]|nr:hypothetical protein Asp14428_68630 [Actinoplanes sp. NBRC 14428]
MTVPGQAQTTYDYNNADQLTTVTRGTDVTGIGYDALGRRQTLTLPAGITQTYGYDDASGLTGITYTRGSTTLGAITYRPDALGRPVHVDGSYARVALPAASAAVTYDAADQRAGNSYDDDGNVAGDGVRTYTWNARGELTAATKAGQTITYAYDGAGRRAARTAAGVTASYLYDGPNVVQEKAGTTTTNVLTGGVDEVFARGGRSLLSDALGSTIASADATSVPAEYTYDPFGATTVSGDDQGNPARFTGREDEGDGLYYYRSRYYSASQQRFLSRDPIGLASGDTNPYAYVRNQPTSLVDPWGTKPADAGTGSNNAWQPDPAEGYPSYNQAGGWLTAHGAASSYGTGLTWEHVVERSQVGKSGFAPEIINHADNLLLLDAATNYAKNGYYSKRLSWTNDKKLRDFLAGMPFHQQWDFGMFVIRTLQTTGKAGLPM